MISPLLSAYGVGAAVAAVFFITIFALVIMKWPRITRDASGKEKAQLIVETVLFVIVGVALLFLAGFLDHVSRMA